MSSLCQACSFNYYNAILRFFENNEASLEFLRSHGVLPTTVTCPQCKSPCTFRKDKKVWRCRKMIRQKKAKKKSCNFSVSDYKDTFLYHSAMPPWKILLYANHFIRNIWDHAIVLECLTISRKTSVDWRSFCSEVTEEWFSRQDPIGGDGVEVEIDQTLISPRKYKKGRLVKQVWLFGGIERITKRRFVVVLSDADGGKRNAATLVPLIKKYTQPGSIIYSDSWPAYKDIGRLGLGYKHFVITDPESPVPTKDLHTRNVKSFWVELKRWVKRPGMRAKYMRQYLSRYLFVSSVSDKNSLLHKFFVQAGKLYPHLSDHQRQIRQTQEESGSETEDYEITSESD